MPELGTVVAVSRKIAKYREPITREVTAVTWIESPCKPLRCIYLGYTFGYSGQLRHPHFDDQYFCNAKAIKVAVVQPLSNGGRYQKRIYVPLSEIESCSTT